jgi:TonB family protein
MINLFNKTSILLIFTLIGSVWVNAQTQLSSQEADKLVVEKPAPRYPAMAEKSKIQGIVKLKITVSEMGTVSSVQTISGHPFLVGPATEAVKKRRYRPYQLNDKPTAFTTIVEVPFSVGIPDDEYNRQQEIARQYFEEEHKCRGLLKEQRYEEAAASCKSAVKIADRLPEHRALEKSGAYEHVGYSLLNLKQFPEALESFTRSYEIGKTVLKESDAETGYAYVNLGMVNHLLGNIDKARDFYDRAEKILRQAYKDIELEDARQEYVRVLTRVLQYRLVIAENSGDAKEIEEIKKRMAKIP